VAEGMEDDRTGQVQRFVKVSVEPFAQHLAVAGGGRASPCSAACNTATGRAWRRFS
jgi:hypothetical protein